LELGAGLGAVWSLGVFRALASDPVQTWLTVAGSVGRVAAIAVALLPATLCFGATLPTLAQALITTGAVGHRGGLLYALNILGGIVGTVAVGFGLPAVIGVSASYSAAAGASLCAGLGALALAMRQQDTHPADKTSVPCVATVRVGCLRLVAAGTGALGLGLEV